MLLLSNVKVTTSTIDNHDVLVQARPLDRAIRVASAMTDVISNLSLQWPLILFDRSATTNHASGVLM